MRVVSIGQMWCRVEAVEHGFGSHPKLSGVVEWTCIGGRVGMGEGVLPALERP